MTFAEEDLRRVALDPLCHDLVTGLGTWTDEDEREVVRIMALLRE